MSALDTCSLCPRLCRSACPVASVTESGTPSTLASALRDEAHGLLARDVAQHASTHCTDCGACERACAIGRPLPSLVALAQDRLGTASEPMPLEPVRGSGTVIVVEPDERPLADAVSRRLRRPVAAWRTQDWLGADALGRAAGVAHVRRVREAAAGRPLWVVDGGSARVGRAAGLEVRWVDEVLGVAVAGIGSCSREGEQPYGCCGGAGALRRHHPKEAAAVGRLWLERRVGPSRDARCAAFLRTLGASDDPVAYWLAT